LNRRKNERAEGGKDGGGAEEKEIGEEGLAEGEEGR